MGDYHVDACRGRPLVGSQLAAQRCAAEHARRRRRGAALNAARWPRGAQADERRRHESACRGAPETRLTVLRAGAMRKGLIIVR